MKILNKEEKTNELLSRKEYKVEIEFEGTVPSKKEVKKELCNDLKANEDLSIVREIITSFGSNKANIEVFVYSDKKEMDRIENYLMHKKIQEKLDKEAEAAKAEEEAKKSEEKEKPAEEAKAPEKKEPEDKKDEPKEEKKEEAE